MSRPTFTLFLITFLSFVTDVTTAQDHGSEKGNEADVQQRPSSEFPALTMESWSGKINVPDPVALSVDNKGDVFVTQTRRRKIQDLDIRANRDWTTNDVGFASVQEKREFFHARMPTDGSNPTQAKRVEDWNKDGQHDWRDLTVVSEAIYRLRDVDDDSKADEITTFAEGFQTEVTGIAAGVLAYNGDVYSTIAPDVWKLRDANDDGVADDRNAIATGFGLHIAYAGHDMHGLTVGPDGKIYWSIGDKGINVETPEGKRFAYPNQGGVMRCNPDGSDFEVFAHGLRNVQEFAFDAHGNIFGVDNDSDQPGEKERFVAIVDAMDAGWRCNYQYRGDDYNPWMDEQLWDVAGKDHPAYIVPPIRHYVDGPAGFKFNPGTALSPAYRDFFFMTNAPAGYQYAFRAMPDGDSFKMVDSHLFASGSAIVGLAFGPDGALYGADWDGGYPLDEKGAVLRFDVADDDMPPSHASLRSEVKQLLHDGFTQREPTELVKLLGHADRRVRLGAQFALVGKNQGLSLSETLIDKKSSRFARLHSVWGLGQLARQGDPAATSVLNESLSDDDPIVLAQVAKTIGESTVTDSAALIALLNHDDLHVQVNAGLAIGRQGDSSAVTTLLKQSDSLRVDQHYLRHSLTRGLAASALSEELAAQVSHQSVSRRMVCVLALRHQGSPLVASFLQDSSSWVASEAARAIHDDQSISAALPALAEMLGQPAQSSESFLRRSINANFRTGTTEASARIIDYLAETNHPESLLVIACESLGQWNDPPLLDKVEGRYRDLTTQTRQPVSADAKTTLSQLVASGTTPVRIAAMVAATRLGLKLDRQSLVELLKSSDVPSNLRVESLNTLSKEQGTDSLALLKEYSQTSNSALAVRAVELLASIYPEVAFEPLQRLLAVSKPDVIQQAAISGLSQLHSDEANKALATFGQTVFGKNPQPALMLEIADAVAAGAQSSSPLARLQRIVNEEQPLLANQFKLGSAPGASKFAFSLSGGDAENGKRIFTNHLQAQCSRCHRIGKSGSSIGPELTKIAKKRDAEYLLRSIVDPSAEIEPKYFTQAILMDTGKIIRGVIQNEGKQKTIVIGTDGKKITLPSDEIEDVSSQKISLMPDMTETLKPQEVRDLVAYLSKLK
jgi:putative membrane-bound dehydrogenase-like protein